MNIFVFTTITCDQSQCQDDLHTTSYKKSNIMDKSLTGDT